MEEKCESPNEDKAETGLTDSDVFLKPSEIFCAPKPIKRKSLKKLTSKCLNCRDNSATDTNITETNKNIHRTAISSSENDKNVSTSGKNIPENVINEKNIPENVLNERNIPENDLNDKNALENDKKVSESVKSDENIPENKETCENKLEIKTTTPPLTICEPQPKKRPEKSPAERMKMKEQPVPYKEPSWGSLPPPEYYFEVIKNGAVVDKIEFKNSFIVLGRSSNCDVVMEHPSISRHHCVIQYRSIFGNEQNPVGMYVYDLGSTHGSFQNKNRLLARKFNRLRVGHMLKFGSSTRNFILQGPEEDQEPELNLTVSELIAMRDKKMLEKQNLQRQSQNNAKELENLGEGISWGMAPDAVESDSNSDSGSSDSDCEEKVLLQKRKSTLTLNDPKKTLRGWFERRGHDDPDYEVEVINPGYFRVKVMIPISHTRKTTVSIEHKGKKKDAVLQCALEACRTLDSKGILRQANAGTVHEKASNEDDTVYNTDTFDDEFLDRTGDVERKRKTNQILDYEHLKTEYFTITSRLNEISGKLHLSDQSKDHRSEKSLSSDTADDLEEYMSGLNPTAVDKHKKITWKLELSKLLGEENKIRNLLNLSRPVNIPEFKAWRDKNTTNKKNYENTNLNLIKPKSAERRKIHEAFNVQEENEKPKLRKIDFNDDSVNIAPIPYTTGSRRKKLPNSRKSMLEAKVPDKSMLEARITEESVLETRLMNKSIKDSDKSMLDDRLTDKSILDSRLTDKSLLQARLTDTESGALTGSSQQSLDLENSAAASELQSQTNLIEISNLNSEQSEANLSEFSNLNILKNTPENSTNSDNTDSAKNSNKLSENYNDKSDHSQSNLQEDSSFIKASSDKPPSHKIIGPIMPKNTSSFATIQKNQKRKRKNFEDASKYESWVPPQDQTGDGRTKLNEKYGY